MTTQAETTDIAVLKTEVINMNKVLNRLEVKIDAQTDLYVTRTEFNEFKSRWLLSHTLSAVMGSVLTGLIVYFLTRR